MIPKGKLLALLMVFTAVGGIAATGAFTTVEAERTAEVDVDGDANALLAVEPIQPTDESDFIGQSDTEDAPFQLQLDDAVNARASTTAEDLFKITNQGAEPVDVWIATQGGAQANDTAVNTSFYISSEHVVSSPSDQSGDVGVSSNAGTDPNIKALTEDISTYNAFVDGDDSTDATKTDLVISEIENNGNQDQEPGENAVVSVAPGESIRVSFAAEIDGNAGGLIDENSDSDDDPAAILDTMVIYAVNDNEDGSTTINQELTTETSGEGETTTTSTE
jgi:hypothetical protein